MSADTSAGSFGRKIKGMAAFVTLLVVLVVAGWFIGAQLYRTAIDQGRAALARDGVTLTCAEESLSGFPARFEWRCASLVVTMANGTNLSGGAFNTVAPVWNPLFTIAEWSGPFRSTTADGFDAAIASDLIRASLRLNTSLELQRLSAVVDPFTVTLQGATRPIAEGNQAELHVRQPVPEDGDAPATSDDLELALLIFGFDSALLGGVDQIDLSISALVEELGAVQARSVQTGLRDWVARSGRITPLATRIRLDEHAINLDGDAAIAPDGRIDFTGSIATNDVAALVDLMGIDDNGTISVGATLFGRQTTIGEDQAIELPVQVTRGAVSIGPVPLGVLPPLSF